MFLLPLLPLTGSPRTLLRLSHSVTCCCLPPTSDPLNSQHLKTKCSRRTRSSFRLLSIAAETLSASPPAELAVKNCRAHVIHFHLEHALHRFLDLCLGRVLRNLKHHRVLRFLHAQTLLGNDGTPDNLINPVLHRLSLLPFGLGFGLRFFFRRGLLCRLFRFRSRVLGRSFRFRALLTRRFLLSRCRSWLDLYRHFWTRRR